MCTSCNGDYAEIFYDEIAKEFYLNHETSQWDYYDDDFVCDRIYIKYCPFCGRKLGESNNDRT